MHLAATDERLIEEVKRDLERKLPGTFDLTSASQAWADVVYARLREALALVRVFAVLRAGDLPAPERAFADRVATVNDDSPVLTLMASRGERSEWNDRAKSRAHLATPLASASLLESSPMVAALFRDLGARIEVGPGGSVEVVDTELTPTPLRTFYVMDAATAVDERGRRTITNRAFVDEHDIRTVFGIGSTFGGGTLFAMILFARQHVSRAIADAFVPLAEHFGEVTAPAMANGALFPVSVTGMRP